MPSAPMSHTRVFMLATLSLLAGGALLFYLVGNVPPTTDGQMLNPVALLLGLAGIFLVTAGAGVLAALVLHRRWPTLAGRPGTRRGRSKMPPTAPAIRQGILCALAVVTLVALFISRKLDIAFMIVTFLIAGLIEAYAQTRK